MATRTRSKGSYSDTYTYWQRRFRTTTPTVGPWSGWQDKSGLMFKRGDPWQQMTDRIDNPGGINPCAHTRKQFLDKDSVIELLGRPYKPTYSSVWYQNQYRIIVPFRYVLPLDEAPLGALSGIKALAIARVPTYRKSHLEAFVSLGELAGSADSIAIRSAGALARFGKLLYQSANWKKTLSREGGRALTALTKRLKPASAKEAWNTVLDGVSTASSLNMEWKYGLAPMLQDIQKANDAAMKIEQIRTRLLDGVRVYGRATESRGAVMLPTVVQYDGGAYSPSGGVTLTLFKYKQTRTLAVASVVRKLASSVQVGETDWFTGLNVVKEINGLDPSAKGFWALMPLSFITDWFWNVGALLESLESLATPPASSISSTDSMYSTSVETTIYGRAVISPFEENPLTSETGALRIVAYNRVLDPLTGGPVLYVPPLNVPTSAGKWWSMAQIGLQQLLNNRR